MPAPALRPRETKMHRSTLTEVSQREERKKDIFVTTGEKGGEVQLCKLCMIYDAKYLNRRGFFIRMKRRAKVMFAQTRTKWGKKEQGSLL